MSELPERVVVGANGAYWRDFGTHYSMCPVSDDNDPVEVVATYVRLPAPDERQAGLAERVRALPTFALVDAPGLDFVLAEDVLALFSAEGGEK